MDVTEAASPLVQDKRAQWAMERAAGENAQLVLPMIVRRRVATGADASGLLRRGWPGCALRDGAPVGSFSCTGTRRLRRQPRRARGRALRGARACPGGKRPSQSCQRHRRVLVCGAGGSPPGASHAGLDARAVPGGPRGRAAAGLIGDASEHAPAAHGS